MSDVRETFERFLSAMFSSDRETLREVLSDDVVWHLPPWARARIEDPKGGERVAGFLCDGAATYYEPGSFRFRPEVEAVEGDQAVVIGWLTARTAAGAAYENRYAFGFRLRDGRICEGWELLDSAHFEAQSRVEIAE